jgi:hypothetical protein
MLPDEEVEFELNSALFPVLKLIAAIEIPDGKFWETPSFTHAPSVFRYWRM